MMFLHLLANLDAIDADIIEAARHGKESPRPHSVRFDIRPPSALRPKSCIQPTVETRCSSPDGKPSKILSFKLKKGPSSSLSARTHGSTRPVSRRAVILHPPSASSRSSRSHNGMKKDRSADRDVVSPPPTGIAAMEPAFFDINLDVPCLRIWRLEGTQLQRVLEHEYGFFHEGNVYIVLRVVSSNERTVHFWLGSASSEADRKLVEDKAHLLDNIVSNAHVFSREIQSYESVSFLRCFLDGIIYVEGKHKTTVFKASIYAKKMYLISGRKYARASCVQPKREFLVSSNTIILDGHPRMYVWIGGQTNYVLRTKAIRIAKKIQQYQRNGRCHVVIIDENDVHLNDLFKKKFDNQSCPAPAPSTTSQRNDKEEEENDNQSENTSSHMVLHRISGDKVLYDMPEAAKRPLKHCYLVKQDSYLLDRGPNQTLYLWVGSIANEEHVMHGLKRAMSFAVHKDYPDTHAVCRIRENYEPHEFKKCFYNWRDHLSKEKSITKRYSVGNIGRALFSRTDRRTIATVKECWSTDSIGEHTGTTQMWVLNEGHLDPWYHTGLFNNNKCYLVLYKTATAEYPQNILYYWMGSKSSSEDQSVIIQLALEKSFKLDNAAVLVRVLDGQEQNHFIATMRNWMMVCDQDCESEENMPIQVYCVREFFENSIRIQQVRPTWRDLNSSSSYVILSDRSAFLWYGKLSGSTERESAKDLLGILCSDKMFSYEIITERKETEAFRNIFGTLEPYEMDYRPIILERRMPRLYCCHEENQTFEDIEDFLQEDLSEECIMVLDVFDQIFVWCGYQVDNGRRKKMYDLAQAFIKQDPAGREFKHVTVWFLSQRHEPFLFTKYFKQWGALGYSGRHSYEVLRKRTRQENAKIDIDGFAVSLNSFSKPKYTYKSLLKGDLPSDVDMTQKHIYLSDKQFLDHLKVSKEDFSNQPAWKQRQILLAARLLYTEPVMLPSLDLNNDSEEE